MSNKKETIQGVIITSPYRLLRLLTGLSVNRFAKEIEISHTYWNDLESGRRKKASPEIIEKISCITGLDAKVVDWIIEGNNTSEKTQYLYDQMILTLSNYAISNRMEKIAGNN